jgi:KDO2-lipid IV(A) lauroyltransferase
MTQACADVLGAAVREHPADWHMLQRVFLADLDPARLAATEAAGASGASGASSAPDSAEAAR